MYIHVLHLHTYSVIHVHVYSTYAIVHFVTRIHLHTCTCTIVHVNTIDHFLTILHIRCTWDGTCNIVMVYYVSINNTITTKLHIHVHVILGVSCVCKYY